MDYFDGKYRILLDGEAVSFIIGDEFNLDWEKEEDSFYFRRKLASTIEFQDTTYDYIYQGAVNQKFIFIIQRREDDAWIEYHTAYFYKSDCSFDDDYKIVSVKPTSDDGGEDVKKVLNNEYDLIALAPTVSPIQYKIKPIYQIIVQTGGRFEEITLITNRIGNVYWTEQITPLDNSDDYADVYGFRRTSFGGGTFPIGYRYERYLTTLTTFNSVATTARPSSDISSIVSGYNRISTQFIDDNFNYDNLSQVEPTIYGQFNIICDEYPNYFAKGFPTDQIFPLAQDSWYCYSFWSFYDDETLDYEILNSDNFVLNDAYTIHDTIQIILQQETDIVFDNTTDFSEFLYSEVNPVSEEDITHLFLTQKSNVINARYTEPARKANIRLSELFDMLRSVYNIFWAIDIIDGEKRLILEHVNWYERGGSYGENQISIDLSNTFDKRNQKPLDFEQSKFKYNKANMPQRYEFSWSDEVGEVFRGQPIRVLDNQINDGSIINNKVNNYITDIDILISLENASLDGFCLFGCELLGSDYVVKFNTLSSISYQNGFLAFQYLIPLYHKYNMPSENIEVNGEETTSDSITRNKQQEVNFAVENLDINPLNLITTSIGSGQVDKMSLNLVNNEFEITLNHDTE